MKEPNKKELNWKMILVFILVFLLVSQLLSSLEEIKAGFISAL
tara:strand:- start:135 stop:263 length:129 start_codon:yes stop_codon:yes gene_type:complete